MPKILSTVLRAASMMGAPKWKVTKEKKYKFGKTYPLSDIDPGAKAPEGKKAATKRIRASVAPPKKRKKKKESMKERIRRLREEEAKRIEEQTQ